MEPTFFGTKRPLNQTKTMVFPHKKLVTLHPFSGYFAAAAYLDLKRERERRMSLGTDKSEALSGFVSVLLV